MLPDGAPQGSFIKTIDLFYLAHMLYGCLIMLDLILEYMCANGLHIDNENWVIVM